MIEHLLAKRLSGSGKLVNKKGLGKVSKRLWVLEMRSPRKSDPPSTRAKANFAFPHHFGLTFFAFLREKMNFLSSEPPFPYIKGVYLDYYGLREAPFSITPNPRFLFYSAKHR